MKRIGIITNVSKPDASQVMARVATHARTLGLTLFTCDDPTTALLPDAVRVPVKSLCSEVDVLIAFGGDGTFLSSVRTLDDCSIPVMGVNLGSLGFMTSVPQEEVERALDVLAADEFITSNRTLALTRLHRNGEQLAEYRALNDIVVGWGNSTRVVTLSLHSDGTGVTDYVCDGMIISTPTGSTGHQLSAGGPILHPETAAFAVNVICPHTLSARPLVVPDSSTLNLLVRVSPKELLLSVDGQETMRVIEGDRIEVSRHPQSLQLLQLPDYDYFAVLRQKLGWRGSVL